MLLTLFVVGTTSRNYVEKHKRLQQFSMIDYDLLLDNISMPIVVTPNTLTETSNWLKMIREPARAEIAAVYASVIEAVDERYIPSKVAAADDDFPRLWLTDTGILAGITKDDVLLTSDFALYEAALRRGYYAVNFDHLRGR